MTDDQSAPRVCIGLPVYNGEASLEDALNSLLAQTYTDFEVVICDNDSTDRTASICQDFAARDARIRYQRNPTNIGAAPNFNRTFALGRSEYFKWMAHDDRIEPEYLEQCVATLDRAPGDVLMVCPRRNDLDADGEFVRRCPHRPATALHGEWEGFHSLTFSELIAVRNRYIPPFIFGLARTEALRKTRLIQGFIGSDRACVSELCLAGQVWQTPDYHYGQRFHAEDSWRTQLSDEEDAQWYDPANAGRNINPSWELFENLLVAVGRSPLGSARRMQHYGEVITYHWGPRSARAARRGAGRVWADASRHAIRNSKASTAPLKTWVLLRKLRRDGVKQLPESLAATLAMRRGELIEQISQMLVERAEQADIALLHAWAQDPDNPYNTGAKRALDLGGIPRDIAEPTIQGDNPTQA